MSGYFIGDLINFGEYFGVGMENWNGEETFSVLDICCTAID